MKRGSDVEKVLAEQETDRRTSRGRLSVWTLWKLAFPLVTPLVAFLIIFTFLPAPHSQDISSVRQGLGVFIGGLILFEMMIVGVAFLINHENRAASLLAQRLTRIYLAALTNSALNPELKILTKND